MSMVINNGNVKTEEDALLKYIRELSKHNPQEARKQILKYLEKNKDNADAYYLYGQIEEKLGHYQDAITAYSVVASLPRGVNKYNAIVKIGVNYKNLGNIEEAKRYLHNAIDNSPKNEKNARITLSAIYRREKNFTKALELLRGIQIQADDVRREIAIILSLQGKKREALDELNKMKTSSPVYKREMAIEKAKLAIALEAYDEAELYVSEAKKTRVKDSLYYQAMHQEAILARGKKIYSRALHLCEELIADRETFLGNVNITLGEIHEDLGNYAEALKNYQTAALTSPDENVSSNGYYHIGLLEFTMGNFEEAEKNLKRSITHTEAANKAKAIKLVSIYLRQERYEEALTIVEKVRKSSKGNTDLSGLSIVPTIIAKKTGKPLPKRNRTYLENQVIEYRKEEALKHIKDNHCNNRGTVSNFSRNIDVDTLFDEIKLQMVDQNMVFEDVFDIYTIDYPNAGYNLENELVDQVRVIAIPGTKDIITMYPSKRRALKRKGQMQEELKEQQKVKSKTIDRFNARLAKKQEKK